jgi:hypothetical protein
VVSLRYYISASLYAKFLHSLTPSGALFKAALPLQSEQKSVRLCWFGAKKICKSCVAVLIYVKLKIQQYNITFLNTTEKDFII